MSPRSWTIRQIIERTVGVVALVLAALGPAVFSAYWISFILTQVFFLGIVAASLIFLSAYGGMVSLCQISIFGIAGFVLGNAVTNGNTKGLNLGWNPWLGVVLGIVIATAVAFLFGALASRSAGIYFLMITLTFAVIANFFFGADLSLSGFGGISGIGAPGLIGHVDSNPNRLYYAAFVLALIVYAVIRYLAQTPFGLTLQGVRDDPVRMSSLGYNVPLHRMMAFGFAGFIASFAGVIFVWWNGHIDPASINIGAAIDLLVIAVIGGLYRLEGAWAGALAFVVIQNYVRTDYLPVVGGTFHTLIGAIFLLIVLVSPGGLMGIWDWLISHVGGDAAPAAAPAAAGAGVDAAAAGTTAAGDPRR
jgi:branched-chain amino acid transport system permease protein